MRIPHGLKRVNMGWKIAEYRSPDELDSRVPAEPPPPHNPYAAVRPQHGPHPAFYTDTATGPLRSVGVAYGLWALCLVGLAGIHRFYAGRYVTGFIWLLTFGLVGIGLVYDLFRIPFLVERKNDELIQRRLLGYR
jgi:TM2 domain-containing membrane protein YozV